MAEEQIDSTISQGITNAPLDSPPGPKTPPRSYLELPIYDTPVSLKSSGASRYSSTHNVTDFKKRALANEMKDFFIGPWDVKAFLDEFLPKPPTPCPETRGADFQTVLKGGNEIKMYEPFLNDARRFAPDLEFVDCHAHEDPVVKMSGPGSKPDICAYPQNYCGMYITNFSKMAFHGEFKYHKREDAFQDKGDSSSLLRDSQAGRDTLGQLVAYATAQLAVQFRTHLFSLGVFHDHARIIRWDRSGAIVTKAFNYIKDPKFLAEFFWRFNFASPEDRGEDISVSRPTDQDAEDARVALGLDPTTPLVQFMVPPESLPDDTHEAVPAFYIGKLPKYDSRSPVGRATRPFTVYDIASKRVVFLKDTWRIDLPGELEKEGEIYKSFHEYKVPYIAEFMRAGDIPGPYQRTITQKFASHRTSGRQFVAHQHYRLVLGTVGEKLCTFSSTRQLVTVVADALEAHKFVWEIENSKKARLHRDVSFGNIMIDKRGRGFLIDWDYSKTKSALSQGASRTDRTGTWQFISAALLQNPTKGHELQDDLESFLHVLTWVALWYSPTDLAPELLGSFLSRIYDEYTNYANMSYGGKAKAGAMASGEYFSMQFLNRPAFKTLLKTLTNCFAVRYISPEDLDHFKPEYLELQQQRLSSSIWMLATIRALAEAGLLPDADGAMLQLVITTPEPLIKKRSNTEVVSEPDDSMPYKKPKPIPDMEDVLPRPVKE